MAINGVKSLLYGVEDVAKSVAFHKDFGLKLLREDSSGADFAVEDGATVLIRHKDDPVLPPDVLERPAVRELVWGVSDRASLDALADDLASDREVRRDADGTLHTTDALGIPLGFGLFAPKTPDFEQVPVNTPTEVRRWNANRKWYKRAAPKLIHHVGFGVPEADIDRLTDFYVERLGFRVTDISRGLAMFLLADGRNDHHSIFLINSGRLGAKGILWNHASYGVENIDELMAGANAMQRSGWHSHFGLCRHRISSAINFYVENPAGGQSEYLTDTDYVDDGWKPRIWEPRFGNYMWTSEIPEFLQHEPEWDCTVVEGAVPKYKEVAGG